MSRDGIAIPIVLDFAIDYNVLKDILEEFVNKGDIKDLNFESFSSVKGANYYVISFEFKNAYKMSLTAKYSLKSNSLLILDIDSILKDQRTIDYTLIDIEIFLKIFAEITKK